MLQPDRNSRLQVVQGDEREDCVCDRELRGVCVAMRNKDSTAFGKHALGMVVKSFRSGQFYECLI